MYRLIGADHVEYGPVTPGQLGEWIAQGRANAATLVWAEGMTDWKPLAQLPEFAAAFGAAGSATPGIIGPNVARRPQTSGLAVAGLILGIVSVLFGWCFFNELFAALGLIFSIVALVQINRSAGGQTGRGLAIAGIILSCIGAVMGLTVFLIFGALAYLGNSVN